MTYLQFVDERIEGVVAVDENSPSENGLIDWLIDNKIMFKTITADEYHNYDCEEVKFEIKRNEN